ncbi:phage tail length tape measure family protein [Paradevosia shaoguanensis]|uniref:Phage tail length tape measure family protein n=1 Tax=Paradevosia shaoguanensis TaxID=1335043 RepID=A0AA41UF62_9HYPH|nr:phage tail length tape measure family protein [Paradevosia shaoguanensis]MCF1744726.1 phage tail length tape measure family protein [Paradevosia shaoguanensis]MCI0129209.1 phage tail length tape measure family protein [Paradevosia shaoguanensis]
MSEVVTKLTIMADGSLRVLDAFEKGMEEAGRATDYTTGAVADFERRMARAAEQIAKGNAVTTQSIARKTAEQRAYERWSSTVDRTTALRIKLEREAAQAAVAASNAVTLGYASQEQALATLTALEQRHAAALAASVGDTRQIAGALGAQAAAADGAALSMKRLAASNDNASWQRRNLAFQLMDVSQMLALGQAPMMTLLQQGPQIAQIYSMEEGGVGRALKESASMAMGLVRAAWPVVLVVGAISAAFAGLTYEINKTAKHSVGLMDTIKATFQVIGEGAMTVAKPALDYFGGLWDAVWLRVVAGTKAFINWSTAQFLIMIDTIGTMVQSIPDAFIQAGEAAANGFLKGIAWMVNQALVSIQGVIDGLNSLLAFAGQNVVPPVFDPSKPFKLPELDLGGGDAGKRNGQRMNDLQRRSADYLTRDCAGEFFGAVASKAEANAIAADKALQKAAKAAEKEAERQRKAYESLTRSATQFIADQERQAQALGMTALEADKLRFSQELLNKAANDNIALTPRMRDELLGLADQMAVAQERTRQLTEAYNFGKSTLGSFFSDFKRELMNGTSLWDAFAQAGANALSSIADKALSMAADGIWDMIFRSFTGFGGGGFGSLGNGIGGGASFGGVLSFLASAKGNAFSNAPGLSAYSSTIVTRPTVFPFARGAGLMGEAGPEAIMPLKRTASGALGVQVANQNQANDNRPSVSIGDVVVSAPGASKDDAQAIAKAIRGELVDMLNARFPDAVQAVQKSPRARGTRYFG